MDSTNLTPVTTNISSPRVPETASTIPTPHTPLELSPEAVELLHTKTLLREAKAKYDHLRTFMHANVRVLQQEIHNTKRALEAETAGRANTQNQFNHWLESARAAFTAERAARADAVQNLHDQEAAFANAEQTIENLREQLEECTCKCECEEHANQAGCKHADAVQALKAKLEKISCSVCLNAESDALFPCAHVPCCMTCAYQVSASNNMAEGLARCPICRKEGEFKKIYFA